MSSAGCYVLHLYCDEPDHDEIGAWGQNPEFAHETKALAWKLAMRVGWRKKTTNGEHLICPNCMRKKKGA